MYVLHIGTHQSVSVCIVLIIMCKYFGVRSLKVYCVLLRCVYVRDHGAFDTKKAWVVTTGSVWWTNCMVVWWEVVDVRWCFVISLYAHRTKTTYDGWECLDFSLTQQSVSVYHQNIYTCFGYGRASKLYNFFKRLRFVYRVYCTFYLLYCVCV